MNEPKKIKRPRQIDYHLVDLTVDEIPDLVYHTESYSAFKLKIKRRNISTDIGELNFLIRDNSNNLRYILLYCFMNEPNNVFKCSYWINNRVLMPDREYVTTKELLDSEKAVLYVKDFMESFVFKKYKGI